MYPKFKFKKNISIIKLGETYDEEKIKLKFPNVITSQDFNSDQEIDYIKETALEFCRKQKLKEAMMKSVNLLQTCSFDEISKVYNIIINT